MDHEKNVGMPEFKKMARKDLVEGFISAINNVHAAFNVLMDQNDEIGDRYNVEKLKANNNNDLCIQLREEIACLKRDNGVLKESNNTKEECMQERQCEEESNNPQEEDDGIVGTINKSKYYNAVFQHIKWEHAQQLLTLAKQLNIEFGQIKPE